MENYIWPEITEDTPIEEVKRIHQRIWDYVIEHGSKPDGGFSKYLFGCSACEYAHASSPFEKYTLFSAIDDFGNVYKVHCFCCNCPIKWPSNQLCTSIDSLFNEWNNEEDPSQKADIAKQIRDLPWKFEVEDDDET